MRQPFYLPIIKGPYSPKHPIDWTPECAVYDMSREAIIEDIATGQIEDVADVIFIDLAAGFCESVVKQIAEEVADYYVEKYREPLPAWLTPWLDSHEVDYSHLTYPSH